VLISAAQAEELIRSRNRLAGIPREGCGREAATRGRKCRRCDVTQASAGVAIRPHARTTTMRSVLIAMGWLVVESAILTERTIRLLRVTLDDPRVGVTCRRRPRD